MKRQYRIWLIRHGKTLSNEQHRYLGKTDEALSETGKRLLMEKSYQEFGHVDALFGSPMLRCQQTADILFPNQTMMVIPDWTEMDFGMFEGKNYQELQGNSQYQAWIDSGGTLPFPKGESREAFIERSLRGYWEMRSIVQAKYDTMDREEPVTVACVVHGGTIMAICSRVLGGDYFDYQVENGAYQCIII